MEIRKNVDGNKFTVEGLEGDYLVTRAYGKLRVNYYPDDGSGVHLVASISAGTYADPASGIPNQGNPDARRQVEDAVKKHAERLLADKAY